MRPRHIALTVAVLAAGGALPGPASAAARKPRLRPFQDCSSLIRYGNRHVGGFDPAGAPRPVQPTPVFAPDVVTGQPLPAAAPGEGAADDTSGTNVQEAGVDEPDVVKTDGRSVFALANGTLRVVDVTGSTPRLIGSLKLDDGYDQQMLRSGDRLLITYQRYGSPLPGPGPGPLPVAGAAQEPTIAPGPFLGGGTTRLALVDVQDPANPKLLRTLDVDASLVASRMTGGTARVVLAATPRGMTDPEVSPLHANAWIPAGTFNNVRRHTTRKRALVACRALRHPHAFAGLQTLTVLTIDLAKGLDPVDADGVMAGGETVYASEDDLFVATQRYDEDLEDRTTGTVPQGTTTEIHRFKTTSADETTYAGSTRVPGFLLSQFSMSERGGVLRVASTDVPPWFAVRGSAARSQSYVTTLRLTDPGGLERLGQVGGLGRGERIYGVRFLGDAGYVVTFRQVDPLYVVDLSDPAAPRVRGELKLPGYSAYLHPAGDGRLIGVGQDATDQGRLEGVQVSLFDVSDLDAPKLLQRISLGQNSSTAAEYDHHAFLYWPKTNLAVLPLSVWEVFDGPGDTVGAQQAFDGAVGLTITDGGITEAGRTSHAGGALYSRSVVRALVVKGRLYTLSDGGLQAGRLDTLAPLGFAAFG